MKKRPLRIILQTLVAAGLLALIFLFQSYSEPQFPSHHEGGLTTFTTENDGDLTPLFVKAISDAKTSICCINYSIKDKNIIQALNSSAQKGVKISIVFDPSASPDLQTLLDSRIKRKYYEGKGLMHMKLLSVDDQVAYLGTANFTRSSLAKHSNTVLRIEHPGIAKLIAEKTHSYPKIISTKPHLFTLPGMEFSFSFLPEDKSAANSIIQLIQTAQNTIHVAMFTFTRMDFAKELVAAHKRGVQVSVSIDESSMKGTSKKVADFLAKNGVEVKKGYADGLFHHKIALIDGKTWIVGSANWTKSAFGKNGEFLIIMQRQQKIKDPLDS